MKNALRPGLRGLLRRLPVPVVLLPPDTLGSDALNARPVDLAGIAGFEIQRAPLTSTDLVVKRAFDILLAGIALPLLSPFLGLLALGVLITSGRPVFFRQRRRGFGGRTFSILKFRTMREWTEDGPIIRQATRNDPRVTRFGAYLRKHSLDELPQIWNVLMGEMSLIGPRPHAEAHDDQYDPLIETYAMRHHVKPGITGWAQINGSRGETRTVGDMEARSGKYARPLVHQQFFRFASWTSTSSLQGPFCWPSTIVPPTDGNRFAYP